MAHQHGFENTDINKNAMDHDHHEQTYGLFLGLTKWVIILTIALLAVMALTLV